MVLCHFLSAVLTWRPSILYIIMPCFEREADSFQSVTIVLLTQELLYCNRPVCCRAYCDVKVLLRWTVSQCKLDYLMAVSVLFWSTLVQSMLIKKDMAPLTSSETSDIEQETCTLCLTNAVVLVMSRAIGVVLTSSKVNAQC
jgi:hypothetical protein